MNKFLVSFSNSIYFIALTSLVFVGYVFAFSVIPILTFLLSCIGLEIPRETLDSIFPYLFSGGFIITMLLILKHKIKKNDFIQPQHLSKKLVPPFIFIAIGSVGLFINIYLSIKMKTGAASGLFFLLPGIWMVGFFLIGCI